MQDLSFTQVEYLTIFTTFIYGYVVTRFFSGWSAMINFRHSIKFSILHLAWTIFAFGLLVDIWWGSWNEGNSIHKHMALYYQSLIAPLLMFVISVILFPSLRDDLYLDSEKYFARIRKRNYLAFIALYASFQLEYFTFHVDPEEDTYINIAAIGLATIGYFSKSSLVHKVIILLAGIILVMHIANQPPIETAQVSELNFSLTEYLTIFIAFIYGFVASRFLSGWGLMISKYDRITFSKEHLAWTILIFFLLLDLWAGSWQRRSYITINIRYFILSLTLPMTFYALATVTFPLLKNERDTDLRTYFDANKKLIFLILACLFVSNTIIANLMEEHDLLSSENIFRIMAIAFALFAAFVKNNLAERLVLISGWIMLVAHAIL